MSENKQIILAVIVKNENQYLNEFFNYYYSIGVDKIIVADNNEINDYSERLSSLPIVNEMVICKKMEIINLRGFRGIQKNFYNYVIDNYEYLWCLFLDADEFLTFGDNYKYPNIREYLEEAYNNNIDAIKVNWLCFGDNNKIRYEPIPVTERFPQPFTLDKKDENGNFYNGHCKSILSNRCKSSFLDNPHTVINGKYFLPDFSATDSSPFNLEKVDYGILFIRHYITKTIEEYMTKRMGRGYADMINDKVIDRSTYPLTKFFLINEKTEEHKKYIEKYYASIKQE